MPAGAIASPGPGALSARSKGGRSSPERRLGDRVLILILRPRPLRSVRCRWSWLFLRGIASVTNRRRDSPPDSREIKLLPQVEKRRDAPIAASASLHRHHAHTASLPWSAAIARLLWVADSAARQDHGFALMQSRPARIWIESFQCSTLAAAGHGQALIERSIATARSRGYDTLHLTTTGTWRGTSRSTAAWLRRSPRGEFGHRCARSSCKEVATATRLAARAVAAGVSRLLCDVPERHRKRTARRPRVGCGEAQVGGAAQAPAALIGRTSQARPRTASPAARASASPSAQSLSGYSPWWRNLCRRRGVGMAAMRAFVAPSRSSELRKGPVSFAATALPICSQVGAHRRRRWRVACRVL